MVMLMVMLMGPFAVLVFKIASPHVLARLFCVTHHLHALHHVCFVSFVSHTTCITCASSRSCFTWLCFTSHCFTSHCFTSLCPFLSILLQFSLSSSLSLPPHIAPTSLFQARFVSISNYPPLQLSPPPTASQPPSSPSRRRYVCQYLCLCLCRCFGTNVEIFIIVLWCRLQTWPETCLNATLGVTMCNAYYETRSQMLFMSHESRGMTVMCNAYYQTRSQMLFMSHESRGMTWHVMSHEVWQCS